MKQIECSPMSLGWSFHQFSLFCMICLLMSGSYAPALCVFLFTNLQSGSFCSTSLIACEATGQINYLIPCIISTVLATAVGYIFNYSVFDMILRLNRLPLLTTFRRAAHAGLYSRDVMIRHPHIDFLTMESTVYDMWKMLSSRQKHKVYPIVVSRLNMTLVGTLTRKDIEDVLGEGGP
jgi:hypothetical protein